VPHEEQALLALFEKIPPETYLKDIKAADLLAAMF